MKNIILLLILLYGVDVSSTNIYCREIDFYKSDLLVTPIFNQIAPLCSGNTPLPILPLVSENGIHGTWSPSIVNNIITTTYTFTPSASFPDATSTTMTIIVVSMPYFSELSIHKYRSCLDAVPILPLISDNGISGTWSPSTVTNSVRNYVFTPNSNQCGQVVNQIVSTLAIPYEVGTEFNSPSVSALNNLNNYLMENLYGTYGTWSFSPIPATNDYLCTFTVPNISGCGSTIDYIAHINPSMVPTFQQGLSFCYKDIATSPDCDYIADSFDIPRIYGTWSPCFNYTTTTTYTFTPTPGQGANPTTRTIEILPLNSDKCVSDSLNCSFGSLVLSNPETFSDKLYARLGVITTENNYNVTGDKIIDLNSQEYIDLLPDTSINCKYFAATIDFSCSLIERSDNNSSIYNNLSKSGHTKLQKTTLSIFPNPSSNSVEISMKNTTFNKVLINSIDGKTVLDKNIENSESFQVDVSNYANGLYIVNVIDKDGQVYNQKLIKN